MRGLKGAPQPIQNNCMPQDLFLWNGEIYEAPFSVAHNQSDSEELFAHLQRVRQCETSILNLIASIKGEFSFVYLSVPLGKVFYGRDVFGRRSLILQQSRLSPNFLLSSVVVQEWEGGENAREVECSGLFVFDVATKDLQCRPWTRLPSAAVGMQQVATEVAAEAAIDNDLVQKTVSVLRRAVERRLQPLPPHCKAIGVLFSGGLDCSVLVRLCDMVLGSADVQIDLLNVAFENERFVRQNPGSDPYDVPDRITGRRSYHELCRLNPDRRFNFVQIDVSTEAYKQSIDHVCSLLAPQNTVMDLSIGAALWHAASGRGAVEAADSSAAKTIFASTAPLLMMGMGADELFGGYSRHRTAFMGGGWASLAQELQLDLDRISWRNLGRDDRVVSDWGKEARMPFLDEDFVAHVTALPLNAKCGFAEERSGTEGGETKEKNTGNRRADVLRQKRLLRDVASFLGLQFAASQPKRAIQFGAKTAKITDAAASGADPL